MSKYLSLFLIKCFLILQFIPLFTIGQTKDSIRSQYFRQRDFGKYLISDIYAPTSEVQIVAGSNLREYNIDLARTNNYLPYNQTNFGAEIPIFTKVKYTDNCLKYKFSISAPICARVWFDFTEPSTAPILNTDYQFAILEFNYLKTFESNRIKNIAIKLLPYFHESSHLGDEITLFRRLDTVPVVWANVSYQTSELAVTINDANGRLTNNTSFKLGIKILQNTSHGWYSIRNDKGDTAEFIKSNHIIESYFQCQNQASKGWLANDRFIRVMSFELRERVQYGYPTYPEKKDYYKDWTSYSANEKISLCFNGYLGWKFNFSQNLIPKFGAYLRVYEGINPYGQFRNISNYQFVGLSMIYEN